MHFENRQPAEDVYTDDIHPLKEFAWLVFGSIGLLLVCAALLGYFAGELAARLPFRIEREYASPLTAQLEEAQLSPQAQRVRAELRELGAQIARDMALPADMALSIHYRDDDTVNAVATLGGNIIFFRGLLEKLDSEDAVAMVLAHEIAHARLRHPIGGLGRGVAVGVVLSSVSAGLGGFSGDTLGRAGMLPLLKFSRDQETDADAAAYAVLAKRYGHVGGAQDLFAVFGALRPDDSRIEMLQTHPLDARRIAHLRTLAESRGWQLEGARRSLPPALRTVRAAAVQKNSVSAPVKP